MAGDIYMNAGIATRVLANDNFIFVISAKSYKVNFLVNCGF